MRVTVRLFARLRDIAGAPELTREVAAGATVGVGLAASSCASSRSSAGTNARSRARSTPTTRAWISAVGDGDEVAFLPPVSGDDETRVSRE